MKLELLSKKQNFDYNLDELLGIMRFDFCDGELANTWHARPLMQKVNEENTKKLQNEINDILFDTIKDFNTLMKLCEGQEEELQVLVYVELDFAKYVVKLVPSKAEYSYLYAYRK